MQELNCDNLDEAIDQYRANGYRLDMIFPADNPREALVSRDNERLRLIADPKSNVQSPRSQGVADFEPETLDLGPTSESEWITGRAGMEYRDLIPGRMDGKVIASHIRLTKGGEVPDYVHYHKVDFQMIYCKRGRIKVVYEDQGPPFWLETGDCVLQPPEIRHRVLFADAGSEVIEIGMPAEHETWVEHEFDLPTAELKPEKRFGSQRFVRHIAGEAADGERDSGIAAATNGAADLRIVREHGKDVTLLLSLCAFGPERDRSLPAPISLEIPI